MVDALSADTQNVVDAMRVVARGIYPPLLEAEGLAAALRAIGRATPVPLALDVDGLDRHRRLLEQALYFCVLETVEVAVQAGAREISTTARQTDTDIEVEIGHDGGGAAEALESVFDRVDAVGGTIDVISSDGIVRIKVQIPIGIEEFV